MSRPVAVVHEPNHYEKHNMTKHYLHTTWANIKNRTLNKNNNRFKLYGGRGIKLQANWETSFVAFKDYILTNLGDRPSPKYSLDRIDNDGDYCEGNLRWSTQTEQLHNKRYVRNNDLPKGVKINGKKFQARIHKNYQTIYLGSFDTVEEAHAAYLVASREL